MTKLMNPNFSTGRKILYPTFVVLVLIIWWFYMWNSSSFGLLAENWEIMVTMVFGSFICGASSEGGGAIAFPVMTLGLNIAPSVARNFSLAIQSIGMTAASLYIIQRKINVEWNAILYGSIGGVFGMIFSTFFLTQLFPPAYLKIFFVSLWLSFGFVLYRVNNKPKLLKLDHIEKVGGKDISLLLVFGVLGGIISGLIGNGIDIIIFAVLALSYSISEKVATPTSILLMTGNTILGLILHAFFVRDFYIGSEPFNYWLACIPIVIFGAPMGAAVMNMLSRRVIYLFLMFIIVFQYVFAYIVFYVTNTLNWQLFILSTLTVAAGYFTFLALTRRKPVA